jgi:hypothetical protein
MVKHVRVVGASRGPECDEDCPHDEAGVLWTAAQRMFGGRAQALGFLRSHGRPRRMASPPPLPAARAAAGA